MDANMKELEKKMGIKIEVVRDMMLDRFCGVDQKLAAIEELLRKIIEAQNQIGTPPEKRCKLTEKNTGGGTETSKNQDKGKNVEEKTDLEGGWGQNKDQISGIVGSTEKGRDVAEQTPFTWGALEEADSGCLGGEVNSFDMDGDLMEMGSPGIDSGLAKPVFEDGLDLNLDGMDAGQTTWGTGPALEDGASSGGRGGAVKTTPETGGGWGEAKSDQGQQTGSWGGWGATKSQDVEPSGTWSSLGKKADIETENGSGAWAQKVSKGDEPAWGSKKSEAEGSGSWGGWGATKSQDVEPYGTWSSLGKKADKETKNGLGAWAQKVSKGDEPAWGSKKSEAEGSGSWGGWEAGSSYGWFDLYTHQYGTDNPPEPDFGMGTRKSWTGSWGKVADKTNAGGEEEHTGSFSFWGKKKDEKTDVLVQDSLRPDQWAAKKDSGLWGKAIQNVTSCKWASAESDQGLGWSKLMEAKTDLEHGWGAQKGGKKPQAQVVTEGSNEKGHDESQKPGLSGWKEDGRGPKRKHPDSPVWGLLTTLKRRLDMFTNNEQEIFNEIETIKQSIRIIMHQKGYNDGDPLSADDQTYILENIFNHHPEKAQKMGAGVDYIMMSKHMKFKESSCFYVVSIDGRKEDFCYHECLWNFISGKYPDKLDEFVPKYFKISEHLLRNRDCGGSGPVEAETYCSWSGLDCETLVAADEAGPRSPYWQAVAE